MTKVSVLNIIFENKVMFKIPLCSVKFRFWREKLAESMQIAQAQVAHGRYKT